MILPRLTASAFWLFSIFCAADGKRHTLPLLRSTVSYLLKECRWGAHLPFIGLEPVGGKTTGL